MNRKFNLYALSGVALFKCKMKMEFNALKFSILLFNPNPEIGRNLFNRHFGMIRKVLIINVFLFNSNPEIKKRQV